MRPRHAALAIVLVLMSLIALHNSPISHSGPTTSSSHSVSMHLVGLLTGWNGTNPTITVNRGDTISVILTSGDILHQFAVDLDNDTASPTGMCPNGDGCSSQFSSGLGTTFNFTASLAPGKYTYFCTFHPTMVGSLVVQDVPPLPLTIIGVSPNPAFTGTTVTLTYTVADPIALTGLSIDWGDGTVTHPRITSTSDTHIYTMTRFTQSQTYTINVTATNSAGQTFATVIETVNDRATTLTITNLSPNPAKTGQSVDLNFTASDPDGTVEATWIDWGDGTLPDLILNETSSSMCQRLNPSLGLSSCTLAPGDLLFSQPADPASIINGSIIIFQPYPATPYYLVAHRVIRIIQASDSSYNQITFWTKGDANNVMDPWNQPNGGVPASQVVAVYRNSLPSPSPSSGRYDTHTYSSIADSLSKTFTIKVNATDNSGLASSQAQSETINDRPPVLNISTPSSSSTTIGQPITISFSSTDPDGAISSFTVNWGDGSSPDTLPASATSDTHSYNQAGSFKITVAATDNSGSTSAILSSPLTIAAPSTPASPAATILGLASTEFCILTGIIVAAIAAATFLVLKRIQQ